jgi:predicted ribosome quality control (RQC) complex YloA/Tae2 family protein
MIGMNHLEIATQVKSLNASFQGGRIQRIFQADRSDLVFDIHARGDERFLMVSLHPPLNRIHTIERKPVVPQNPPTFCMSLRKHLIGNRLIGLSTEPGERIVRIATVKGDTMAELVVEMFGPAGNAFLLDQDGVILDLLSIKKAEARQLGRGEKYVAPPPPNLTRPVEVRDLGPDPEAFFESLKKDTILANEKKRLGGFISREKKRGEKYLTRMKTNAESIADPELVQKQAELLMIHLALVKRGNSEILVPDTFDPDQPEIRIELDPKLDGPRNGEKLFKRARRNRRKQKALAERIEQIEQRVYMLVQARAELDEVGALDELSIVLEILDDLGIATGPKVKRRAQVSAGPREYASHDGNTIYVGRSAKENDAVTFKLGRGNDYWLHALGSPGSHVLIRMKKNEPLKQETLLDAATLAAWYSKLKESGGGEVVYTQRKYVTKPKGAPAGKVTHSQGKSIAVRLEKKRLERLLGSVEKNY